jgi:hypothetical protein
VGELSEYSAFQTVFGKNPGNEHHQQLQFVSGGVDKADLFFFAHALKRGMSIEEIARFPNRSEEEVRRRAGV